MEKAVEDELLRFDRSKALYVACATGDVATVERDFSWRRGDTETCYDIAACYGQVEVVKWLLKKGLKTDPGPDYRGPLEWAATRNRLEVASLLLGQEWISSERRAEAMFLAACEGYTGMVRLCLEAGADAHTCENWTLITAARNGHMEIVRLLVDEWDCRLTDERLSFVHEGECKEYIRTAASRYTKSAARKGPPPSR